MIFFFDRALFDIVKNPGDELLLATLLVKIVHGDKVVFVKVLFINGTSIILFIYNR